MFQDVAVITFQVMCHILKNYMPDIISAEICGGTAKTSVPVTPLSDTHRKVPSYKPTLLEGDPIVDKPILLSSILHGLAVMTEKFKLKWTECVETICLLALAQEILKHPGIEPKVSISCFR